MFACLAWTFKAPDVCDLKLNLVFSFQSREEVIRWEESKKWQKRIESLKGKLKEKTEECEKAEKSIQMMKDIIARNDKEKAAFQAKLKRFVYQIIK